MATTQSSSTRYSPQDNRELAIKLADACVNPSYMADLWTVYFRRFEEVLAAERVGYLQGDASCFEPTAQQQ